MNEESQPTNDEVTAYAESPSKRRPWIKAVAIGAAGLIAGGVAATTLSASADETATTSSAGSSTSQTQDPADPSQPMRADEELLTGDTLTKVEAAVMKEYPGATIERTETDSGGVYESHIVTADGEMLTVLVGEDFAITGTEAGRGGPGGHDGHDGDGRDASMGEAPPADAPADGSTDSSASTTDA